MGIRPALTVLMIVLPTATGRSAVRAQDPADEKSRADQFLAFSRTEADRYTIKFTASDIMPFERSSEPVPRWSNPQAGLLTQPVYRYEGTEGDLIDGALFTFAQGTDPEVFLLLEARTVGGKPQWQYGLTRMNSVAFQVSYRGREVWSVPILPWPQLHDPSKPYITFRFEPTEAAKP